MSVFHFDKSKYSFNDNIEQRKKNITKKPIYFIHFYTANILLFYKFIKRDFLLEKLVYYLIMKVSIITDRNHNKLILSSCMNQYIVIQIF
jgi:hypothetical protein